ncbi:hypothetical protein R1flu_007989 [Riccia fluitans]|uniref:Uncharacterized protein n=1 Tax=Riccia fluitans TaxID=41844 RepID=A0ABD1YAF0_9MARC
MLAGTGPRTTSMNVGREFLKMLKLLPRDGAAAVSKSKPKRLGGSIESLSQHPPDESGVLVHGLIFFFFLLKCGTEPWPNFIAIETKSTEGDQQVGKYTEKETAGKKFHAEEIRQRRTLSQPYFKSVQSGKDSGQLCQGQWIKKRPTQSYRDSRTMWIKTGNDKRTLKDT